MLVLVAERDCCICPSKLQYAHQWVLQDAVLQVGNVYGWTGGIKGSKAADRTNDLMAIIANEFDSQEAGPKMIVGA